LVFSESSAAANVLGVRQLVCPYDPATLAIALLFGFFRAPV
jgi:hypothetical protein